MLTQGRFLISYQVFDNIPVNNNGQTHVREILNDTQAFTINYRTEQIRDYLRYPGEELIPEHLHMINALKEIRKLLESYFRKGNHNRYHTHSSAMITMVCIYKIKVLYLHQIINLSIYFKNFRLMKNNELLKKYAGISTRIRRIFAYHYDQIQREVQTEISTLNPELQAQFMDLIIEYMEESINWPDPDDQETFEKQLLG